MDYVQYERLKKSLDNVKYVGLKDLSIGSALSIPIAYQDVKKKHTLGRIILSIISLLFTISYQYTIKNNGNQDNKKVLFFFSHIYSQRSDYYSTMNKVCEIYDNRCELNGEYLHGKGNKMITLQGLKNVVYLPVWFYQLRKLPCEFTGKVTFLYHILESKRWYDYLVKNINPSHYQALVTFFDARLYDNILVQYFKIHNIATATLQHGHFNASKPGATSRQLIGIAFEGFVSDKFFAWGEYSKFEAMKNGVSSNRIQCVGCPKYIGYEKNDKTKANNMFGIILDGGNNLTYQSNIEMIKIANEIARKKQMKYVIKPHPVSDMSCFEPYMNKEYLFMIIDKSETVEDYARRVDFSMAMGSSVYLELLYIGEIVFRYVSEAYVDRYELIQWGIVKNAEDFLEQIDTYHQNPQYIRKMNQIAADLLCEVGNIGENYRRAINELVESNRKRE